MECERPKFMYIYLDNEETLNLLSDEDRGRLLSLLIRFAKGEDIPEIKDNLPLAILFSVMSRQIERDFAAYEQKCIRNRENAKKGGAPSGNRNACKNPKTTENNRTVVLTTQNNRTVEKTTETTEEEEKEKEEYKEEEKEEEKEKEDTAPAADAAAVISLFHQHCPSLPRVRESKRRNKLIAKAEVCLNGTDFESYFRQVGESDFLSGRSGKWSGCTFDWLLNPETIEAVLDGAYDDRSAALPTGYTPSCSYDIKELEKIDTLDFMEG